MTKSRVQVNTRKTTFRHITLKLPKTGRSNIQSSYREQMCGFQQNKSKNAACLPGEPPGSEDERISKVIRSNNAPWTKEPQTWERTKGDLSKLRESSLPAEKTRGQNRTVPWDGRTQPKTGNTEEQEERLPLEETKMKALWHTGEIEGTNDRGEGSCF